MHETHSSVAMLFHNMRRPDLAEHTTPHHRTTMALFASLQRAYEEVTRHKSRADIRLKVKVEVAGQRANHQGLLYLKCKSTIGRLPIQLISALCKQILQHIIL
jgi:hypothetical protein